MLRIRSNLRSAERVDEDQKRFLPDLKTYSSSVDVDDLLDKIDAFKEHNDIGQTVSNNNITAELYDK